MDDSHQIMQKPLKNCLIQITDQPFTQVNNYSNNEVRQTRIVKVKRWHLIINIHEHSSQPGLQNSPQELILSKLLELAGITSSVAL